MSVLLTIALAMSLTAFAADVPLVASTAVPAANGKINYEHDRNGNIKLEITTKNLAAPDRLTPPKNVYVVWIKTPDGQVQNAGALKVNDDLEGSLKTTTPAKAFDVLITAEDNASVNQPTGPDILHAAVQVP